jgi:HSP20 family molecular chaperone IbpA
MDRVDVAIQELERFYRAFTGNEIPAREDKSSFAPEIEPVAHVQRQLEHLLRALPATAMRRQPWTPTASIIEDADGYLVSVDAPGVRSEDIEVVVDGRHLDVRGRRDLLVEGRIHASDRPFGAFRRTLLFPLALDAQRVETECEDGVITVRVRRAERASRPA